MASSSTVSQPITLHFQNVVRVAGETIEGHVDLNMALAQKKHIEQLRAELTGYILTEINDSDSESTTTHKQTIPLFHSNLSLWKQEAAFPEAGSYILKCPFRFQLPANLPPSFYCFTRNHDRGTVRYSLRIVGDRSGRFRSNRRILKLISVVPSASQNQLEVKESLMRGWSGAWKDIKRQEELRQGIWGDYSKARATVPLVPDLSSFPIATPIPFNLEVETETKLVHRSESPEEKGKQMFPAPPARSSEVKQVIKRTAEIRVQGRTSRVQDTFDLSDSERVSRARTGVQAVVDEPEWIPKEGKEDRGIWKRKVHFNSTLTFPFAPTFGTKTLDWSVTLFFVVPFPGIGNDLKLQFPIHLGPGSACPPPPIGVPGLSSLNYADVIPAGPPPMQDLPPCAFIFTENVSTDTFAVRTGQAMITTSMTRRNDLPVS
ncbi:hypothetical protein C8R44DRAFT_613468 [Mycena epipterygia]|nr:hypothetical protein C8R44DRAFT_613468 [Mycena epipterygia]